MSKKQLTNHYQCFHRQDFHLAMKDEDAELIVQLPAE
jgi:hypothetical protein